MALCVGSAGCSLLFAPSDDDYASSSGMLALDVECSTSCSATTVEIGSFAGSCPTIEGDARASLILARSGGTPRVAAAFGSPLSLAGVRRGPQAFYVLYRDASCAIIGAGCRELDYRGDQRLAIPLSPLAGAVGACRGPDCACKSAATDAPGACALEITAAGQIASGVTTPVRLAGPALAATKQGFVLALRTLPRDQKSSTLFALLLSDAGRVTSSNRLDLASLESGCVAFGSGIGLAYDGAGEHGLIAVTRPDCEQEQKSALLLGKIDASGALARASLFSNQNSGLSLSRAHALAPGKTAEEFQLAYTEAQQSYLATFDAGELVQRDATVVFGSNTSRFVRIARGGTRSALMLGEQEATLLAYADEASATSASRLPSGSEGSVVAWDQGALALVPGSSSIAWAARAAIGTTTAMGTIDAQAPTVFTSVDAGVLGDYVAIVAGAPDSLALHRLTGATAGTDMKTSPIAPSTSSKELMLALARGFDGAHVTAASARGLFVFAWAYTSDQATGLPLGGWAIARCL